MSVGPVPWIWTIVAPLVHAECGVFAGTEKKAPLPSFCPFDLSSLSPKARFRLPDITVTFSVPPWVCGGTVALAGSLSRMTWGPLFAGSPDRTAACTPGPNCGAGAHLILLGVTTVFSSAYAAVAREGQEARRDQRGFQHFRPSFRKRLPASAS